MPAIPLEKSFETNRKGLLWAFVRLNDTLTSERVIFSALFILTILTLLLPLNPLTVNRFHHDEALYSTWALFIASGRDTMLRAVPIDKPPLFLYTLALFLKVFGVSETIARLPSLLATAGSVILLFNLGRHLYNGYTGLLTAVLFVLSPFTILFAPTAFTDPMLVAFVLAACFTAVSGRSIWTGVMAGLAFATKQQGLLFLPLIITLVWLGRLKRKDNPGRDAWLIKIGITFAVIVALIFLWDAVRIQRPGFLLQSVLNYGGLGLDLISLGQRLSQFVRLLHYAAPTIWLQVVFLMGLPLRLWSDLLGLYVFRRTSGQVSFPHAFLADWILSLFCLGFLLGHIGLTFAIWDRYLLGLVPFLALLLARVLLWPWQFLKRVLPNLDTPILLTGLRPLYTLLLVLLIIFTFAVPVQNAVASRYPIGGDHGAHLGIDDIAAYLRRHAGSNVTLHHHWLGTHWRFYLWDYPYDLRYWLNEVQLAEIALERAESVQYIAFPAWRSETMARLALSDVGLTLREVYRTQRLDGAPSILLYRIEGRSEQGVETPR